MNTLTYSYAARQSAPVRLALICGLSLSLFAAPAERSRAAAPDADPVVQAAFEKGTLTEGQKSLEAAVPRPPPWGGAPDAAQTRRLAPVDPT